MNKIYELPSGFRMSADVQENLAPFDTLFIHGNLASNTWWEPSLALWRAQRKPSYEGRMIFAEWRGSGKSDAPRTDADLTPAAMADDYVALLKTLGVRKANLVGHSTGGLIALFALLKAPELFHRVVLLDSVGATGAQFPPEALAAFTQMSQDRAFCQMIMNTTIHQNMPSDPLFQRIVDDSFGIAKSNWHGIPKALSNIDIVSDLAKIKHPVLVLHGEHDPILPLEGSKTLAEKLPHADFIELKDQGHSANVENPALFNKLVNQFLFERQT